jgi:hypothetical protein
MEDENQARPPALNKVIDGMDQRKTNDPREHIILMVVECAEGHE